MRSRPFVSLLLALTAPVACDAAGVSSPSRPVPPSMLREQTSGSAGVGVGGTGEQGDVGGTSPGTGGAGAGVGGSQPGSAGAPGEPIDDPFEDNDTRETAALLPAPGPLYRGDDDWFRAPVCGDTAEVSLLARSPLELEVFAAGDPAPSGVVRLPAGTIHQVHARADVGDEVFLRVRPTSTVRAPYALFVHAGCDQGAGGAGGDAGAGGFSTEQPAGSPGFAGVGAGASAGAPGQAGSTGDPGGSGASAGSVGAAGGPDTPGNDEPNNSRAAAMPLEENRYYLFTTYDEDWFVFDPTPLPSCAPDDTRLRVSFLPETGLPLQPPVLEIRYSDEDDHELATTIGPTSGSSIVLGGPGSSGPFHVQIRGPGSATSVLYSLQSALYCDTDAGGAGGGAGAGGTDGVGAQGGGSGAAGASGGQAGAGSEAGAAGTAGAVSGEAGMSGSSGQSGSAGQGQGAQAGSASGDPPASPPESGCSASTSSRGASPWAALAAVLGLGLRRRRRG